MYKPQEITNVNSIGVIMFGLLGDVFIRTPALKALKELYADAKIIAIVDPIGALALENNKFCDETIIVDRDKKNKINYQINKIKSFFAIRSKKLDLVVDMYNGGSSYFLTFASGAKYKLGHYNSSKKNIYNIDYSHAQKIKGLTTYYKDSMSIINILDSKNFSTKPIFDVLDEINKKMYEYLSGLHYDHNKMYLLNFGSGGEEKLLDAQKYAQLVKHIYNTYQYIPLVICNPGQEYLQENFIKEYLTGTKIPYVQLEKLSLQEIGALVQNTTFIITPDTGLMHLSMAFDKFIYAVFTHTNPILVDPQNSNFIAVYEEFSKDELFKTQNITNEKLIAMLDTLFVQIKGSKV